MLRIQFYYFCMEDRVILKYHLQGSIKKSFIVVNWDQRGSGKSYSNNISKESMNKSRFIDDTKELIGYLCTKYKKEQVYLVGHSWGSELGMHIIDKYPEKIAAFISIGQVVNGLENEVISFGVVFSLQNIQELMGLNLLLEVNLQRIQCGDIIWI